MDYRQRIDELSHPKIRKVFRGLDPNEVQTTLQKWVELARELAQRDEILNEQLSKSQQTEQIMAKTILYADKVAATIQEQANVEAMAIRNKAEEEVAEIIEQAKKKAEAQERSLIDRRTILEKKMALYEHESNLLLYRFYDLAKYHLDELGQEVSTEVQSLLQRLGTDWEMIPQLPFPFMESKEPGPFQAPESAISDKEENPVPKPSPVGEAAEKDESISPPEKAPSMVEQAPPEPSATPPSVAPEPATVSQEPQRVSGSPTSSASPPITGEQPVPKASSAPTPPLTAFEAIPVVPSTPVVEPTPTSPASPTPERAEIRSAALDTPAQEKAGPPPSTSSKLESPPAKETSAEELRRVEEALLCGRVLNRDIRDAQGRLVVGQGTKVTREMIHFLIGKSLYGELLSSVSDQSERQPERKRES